jgi:hypothetical protein
LRSISTNLRAITKHLRAIRVKDIDRTNYLLIAIFYALRSMRAVFSQGS